MWLMKKTLLLTGLATMLAFQSCTMDEIEKVNQGTPIGFRTSVATRGTEAQESTLEDFYCTAWLETEDSKPYFENLWFNYSGGSYVSNPTYYWPKGKKLSFYAYAPKVEDMGNGASINITNETQEITGYQVSQNIDEQDDLIFASNTELEETPFVSLNFAHMLSKINICARTYSDLYQYKFAGARIGGVNMKGNVNLNSKDWTNLSNLSNCERTDVDNPIIMNPNSYAYDLMGQLKNKYGYDRDNFAFMIPQEFTAWDPSTDTPGAYISVLVQINTAEGTRVYPATGEYDWVAVPIPSGKWEAGYQYTYYLDFTDGAGYVDPAEPDAGNSILGESIKITMTMNDMEDAETGVVKNKDMIGLWEAYYFKYEYTDYKYNSTSGKYDIIGHTRTDLIENGYFEQTYTYYNYNEESGVYTIDEARSTYEKTEYKTEDEFFNYLNQRAGNFGYVKIDDGTKLWTKGANGLLASAYDVVREDYNGDGKTDLVMYIESYEDPNNPGSYLNIPVIEELIPVSDNGNGSGTVRAYGKSSSWEDKVTIYYNISPIDESTE